jgi:hypothetical protein
MVAVAAVVGTVNSCAQYIGDTVPAACHGAAAVAVGAGATHPAPSHAKMYVVPIFSSKKRSCEASHPPLAACGAPVLMMDGEPMKASAACELPLAGGCR